MLLCTIGLAALAVGWSLSAANYATLAPSQWFSIAFLFALYVLADANAIPLNFRSTSVSINISTGIDIALVLLFGPTVAVPFVALAVIVTELHARRPPVKLLFNAGAFILFTSAASFVLLLFGRVGELPLADGWQVLAWLLAAGVHAFVNVMLLALMISSVSRTPFIPLWRELSSSGQMQQWTQPPVGALIAILQLHSPWALVLAVLPLAAI